MDDQDDVDDETVELDEPAAAPPSPYRFDSDDVPAAASILDVAFANLIDGWEGWGAVDEAAKAASVPVADHAYGRSGNWPLPRTSGLSGKRWI